MAKVRGCGTRVRGGVYLEVPLVKKGGRPLDDFLVCPPVPVQPEAMRLEPRGVSLIRRPNSEVYDVYDWVGAAHYPNVADVIAEGRRLGFSRRVPRNLDFRKLSADSRLILLHSRALIRNADALRRALLAELRDRLADGHPDSGQVIRSSCPRGNSIHTSIHDISKEDMPVVAETCHALYHDDIEGGELVLDPDVPWRTVERQIGETVYRARRRPDGFVPDYGLAIFAVLPIGHITVIRDPDAGTHIDATARARRAQGLDVIEEDE